VNRLAARRGICYYFSIAIGKQIKLTGYYACAAFAANFVSIIEHLIWH
jgi:hypothetical protein